jgi:antitoxin PrlF
MRVTEKGQVTIPSQIRELLGIKRESEVEFVEENGKVYIAKAKSNKKAKRFRKYRGTATIKMTTDEIMALTRGKE